MKKIIDQTNHEESLINPPGDFNPKVLEDILDSLHLLNDESPLSPRDKIRVKGTRRVRRFDPENADWEDYTRTYTFGHLKRVYAQIEKREYKYNPDKHINPWRGAHFGPVIIRNGPPAEVIALNRIAAALESAQEGSAYR